MIYLPKGDFFQKQNLLKPKNKKHTHNVSVRISVNINRNTQVLMFYVNFSLIRSN